MIDLDSLNQEDGTSGTCGLTARSGTPQEAALDRAFVYPAHKVRVLMLFRNSVLLESQFLLLQSLLHLLLHLSPWRCSEASPFGRAHRYAPFRCTSDCIPPFCRRQSSASPPARHTWHLVAQMTWCISTTCRRAPLASKQAARLHGAISSAPSGA